MSDMGDEIAKSLLKGMAIMLVIGTIVFGGLILFFKYGL
jgi:hypothetical protein